MQRAYEPPRGRVTLVGAGPGAPDLITLRGFRALQEADVVLYDALIDERVLDEVRAERVYVGKRCGQHAVPQERILELLREHALLGKRVVRLKGGDPMVLGRGGEEMQHLAAHGIPCEYVPGVSSSISAPAFAGIPVTHRGVADGFVVVSAHPRAGGENFSIPRYHPSITLVLLMGVTTVGHWAADLMAKGYPADLPVAFVTEASTDRQRVVCTTVCDAADAVRTMAIESPSVAVVGHVVSLRAGSEAGERRLAQKPLAGTP